MTSGSQIDSILKKSGFAKTDMDCHSCRSLNLPDRFIATIDYSLNGNHEIECPRCGHLHYRVIKEGKVTSERYSSDHTTHRVERRNVWKAQNVPVITSTASAFIRDRWLDRGT